MLLRAPPQRPAQCAGYFKHCNLWDPSGGRARLDGRRWVPAGAHHHSKPPAPAASAGTMHGATPHRLRACPSTSIERDWAPKLKVCVPPAAQARSNRLQDRAGRPGRGIAAAGLILEPVGTAGKVWARAAGARRGVGARRVEGPPRGRWGALGREVGGGQHARQTSLAPGFLA